MGIMSEPTHSQPEERIRALATDLRTFVGQLKRRLREQADVADLTPSQTAVLLRLERDGPATVSALARAEGVRPQSMGATVAALEAAGHVAGASGPGRRAPDDHLAHRRVPPVDRRGRAARQDWLSRAIAERLGGGEQQELERAVRLLRRLVDP